MCMQCSAYNVTTGDNSLNMHTVIFSEHKGVGHKVVLHTRIHLDDVPPLPTDVEVENPATLGLRGLLPDGQGV